MLALEDAAFLPFTQCVVPPAPAMHFLSLSNAHRAAHPWSGVDCSILSRDSRLICD